MTRSSSQARRASYKNYFKPSIITSFPKPKGKAIPIFREDQGWLFVGWKPIQIQSLSVTNVFTDTSPFNQNWRDYLFQFEKRPPSNEGRKTLVLTFVQIESRLKVVDVSVQLKCFELYTSETPFSRLPSGTLFGHSTRNRQIELTQVWNFRH